MLVMLQAVRSLIPFIYLPYLLRSVGVEGFGVIVLGQAIAQIAVMMTDTATTLTAPRDISVARNDPRALSATAGTIASQRTMAVIACLGGAGILFAFYLSVGGEWSVLALFLVGAAGSIASPVWLFRGLEWLRVPVAVETAWSLAGLIAVLIFVDSLDDVVLFALIYATQRWFIAASWIALAVSRIGRVSVNRWREASSLMQRDLPVFIAVLATSAYTHFTLIVTSAVLGPAAAGVLGAARRVVDAGLLLLAQLIHAYYPSLARLAAEDPLRAKASFRRALIAFGAIGFVASLSLFALAPIATQLLTGVDDAGIEPALRLLAPVAFSSLVAQLAGSVGMLAFRKDRSLLMTTLIAAVVHSALLFPVMHLWSVNGVAALIAVTESLLAFSRVTLLLLYHRAPAYGSPTTHPHTRSV